MADADDDDISEGDVDAEILAAEEDAAAAQEVKLDAVDEDLDEDYGPEAELEYREICVTGTDRMMSEVLDANEVASLIAIRTQQISRYCNEFIEMTAGLDTAEKIATEELRQRRCPLVVRRDYPRHISGGVITTKFELWYPNEMVFAVPL